MKHIVVTGANGFVGRALSHALLDAGDLSGGHITLGACNA
jgi:nucleoside-diphosphate-sugar epimerase